MQIRANSWKFILGSWQELLVQNGPEIQLKSCLQFTCQAIVCLQASPGVGLHLELTTNSQDPSRKTWIARGQLAPPGRSKFVVARHASQFHQGLGLKQRTQSRNWADRNFRSSCQMKRIQPEIEYKQTEQSRVSLRAPKNLQVVVFSSSEVDSKQFVLNTGKRTL